MTGNSLFNVSDIQRPDWICQERSDTGYLGYAGVIVRRITKGIVSTNSTYWTCPHVHRSDKAAMRCAHHQIKQTVDKIHV